jgi:hypothetical protein
MSVADGSIDGRRAAMSSRGCMLSGGATPVASNRINRAAPRAMLLSAAILPSNVRRHEHRSTWRQA